MYDPQQAEQAQQGKLAIEQEIAAEVERTEPQRLAQGKAVIIRKGTQGGAVHFLQSMLAMHNYQVKQDGKFGPDTEKAVKEFQESRSLDVDGLVGKETWDKLLTRPKFGPVEEVTEGSSVGELRDALKHADRNVRKAAAEEIWKRGEEAEIALSDLLDVALKDKDEFVSDSAADALGKLGEHMPEAFFQEIAGHLRDGDGVFAGKAGRAADVLGKLGDDVPAAVVDEIVGLLQSSDQKARSAALSTLFRLGANAGPALRHLRKLVQNKHGNVHWTVRSNAIGTIGHLGAGAKLAIGDLCDAMQEDEEWWVRRAAADALGELGEHAVPCLEGLTGALMDEELSVRMGAASALGDLGKHAARSLPMLRAALNDSKSPGGCLRSIAAGGGTG